MVAESMVLVRCVFVVISNPLVNKLATPVIDWSDSSALTIAVRSLVTSCLVVILASKADFTVKTPPLVIGTALDSTVWSVVVTMLTVLLTTGTDGPAFKAWMSLTLNMVAVLRAEKNWLDSTIASHRLAFRFGQTGQVYMHLSFCLKEAAAIVAARLIHLGVSLAHVAGPRLLLGLYL